MKQVFSASESHNGEDIKVTIITATFNSESTIIDALTSVRDQSYENVEHLIIDGASTDATLGLIETFGNPRCWVISSPDSGIYDALNKGLRAATGDIIGVLHSDDVFAHSDCLANVVALMAGSGADGCYADLEYVSKNNLSEVFRYWRAGSFKGRSSLVRGWMPPHPTLFVRSRLRDYCTYNTCYKISADYDLILRLFLNENLRFEYLQETLVKMRVGGVSNKNICNILTKMSEDFTIIRAQGVGGVYSLFLKSARKTCQLTHRA